MDVALSPLQVNALMHSNLKEKEQIYVTSNTCAW